MSDFISQLSLSNDEWLSRILRKSRLTPIRVAEIFLVFILVRDILLAAYFGALFPSAKSPGLAKEPLAFLMTDLAQAIILGGFCWLQVAGDKLISGLVNENILEFDENLYRELAKGHRHLRSPWLLLIATVLSVGYAAGLILVFPRISGQLTYPSWGTAHPAIVWIALPVTFMVFYALVMSVLDLIILISVVNRVFRRSRIQIQPLHPDRAGGLAAVGQFSANLGYGMGLIGLTISVGIVNAIVTSYVDYAWLLGLTIYLLVAPIIFFLPLWSAHVKMADHQKYLVKEVSRAFDEVFAQLRASRSQDPEESEPLLKRMRQLDEMRARIMQFPLWPFNVGSVRKFFGLVLSPALPAVISGILEWLGKLL
jgi:hypothetical protein